MSTIDLSALPEPEVVESLDFETELQRQKDAFSELEPDWDADVESDPVVKILEVSAYDEVTERQRVNDAALAVMLPWSSGDDAENLIAWFNKTRNTIKEATDDTDAVMESDSDFKNRALLSWNELTNAGTKGSYKAHAKNASSSVKDAVGVRDSEGNITVYILSYDGDGTASDELIAFVQDYFDDEDIYQLCTIITVKSAIITEYPITSELSISDSILASTLLTSAEEAAQAFVDDAHYLGTKVSLSALYKTLHLTGVNDVTLTDFSAINPDENTAAYCTNITITAASDDEEG